MNDALRGKHDSSENVGNLAVLQTGHEVFRLARVPFGWSAGSQVMFELHTRVCSFLNQLRRLMLAWSCPVLYKLIFESHRRDFALIYV